MFKPVCVSAGTCLGPYAVPHNGFQFRVSKTRNCDSYTMSHFVITDNHTATLDRYRKH